MSKKKHKKFKKKKKHGHIDFAPAQPRPVRVEQPAQTTSTSAQTIEPEELEAAETNNEPTAEAIAAEKKEYAYVRRDVKKILVVLGSIVVLLIIVFYINQKTPLFYSLGDWLYRVLNIQTQ